MVLWASALLLAASSAGLVMLSSTPILGELSALGFAVSLFIVICASEALNEGSTWRASVRLRRLQLHAGLVAVRELDAGRFEGGAHGLHVLAREERLADATLRTLDGMRACLASSAWRHPSSFRAALICSPVITSGALLVAGSCDRAPGPRR
jgi:hypothetical protein